MQTKICFKCDKEKALDDFYKHPKMADGRLNKCKQCTKSDVSSNYRNNRQHYIAYEESRQQTPERKTQQLESQRRRRANPKDKDRYRAYRMTAYHLRVGNISKKPCAHCGEPDVEAHHEDYRKPLDIIWLCRGCHMAVHGKAPF